MEENPEGLFKCCNFGGDLSGLADVLCCRFLSKVYYKRPQ